MENESPKEALRKPSTPFDEEFLRHGFLAKYSPTELARVREHSSREFEFADRLNRRLMEILRQLQPRKDKSTEVLGMLLFVKALNAFQGGILLCQRGLLVESQALARITLECTIHLMAVSKDPGHVEVMLSDYDRHKKTHAAKLLEHHDASGSGLSPQVIEVLIQNTELEGNSIKLEQLARSVGMSKAYDSMYRGTSGYGAHATLGALQQLIGEGDKDKLNVVFGGNLSGMRHSLTNVLMPAVDLMEPVGVIFNLSLEAEALRFALDLSELNGEPFKFDNHKHIT